MASSFLMPTGFDPFAYLASLPEQEQAEILETAAVKVGEYQERAQQTRTQEGLVRRFKETRAKFLRPGGVFADELARGQLNAGDEQVSFSDTDAKPSADVPSLRSLKPMIATELEVGTTHRGRYLCGWVAVDNAFFGIASTSLLLEDVTGQLVEVAAYGLVDPDLPPWERQRRVARQFPKGKPVVVYEPYYKVRQDMSEGIRVDQPRELVGWIDVPTDLLRWKTLGNDFFAYVNARNQGRGALACYQRALGAAGPEVGDMAVLLNNIATCRLEMGDLGAAVRLAGAAVHLDPAYVKGWFRLASVLMKEGTAASPGSAGRRSHMLAARVVVHAVSVIPNITPKQRRLLEGALASEDKQGAEVNDRVHSYAGWCAEVAVPASALLCESSARSSRARDSCGRKRTPKMKSGDAWRKEGSKYFASGKFKAAEECYRKGVAASAAFCRDASLVLNNIAAVYLTLHRESRDAVDVNSSCLGSSTDGQVPSAELGLLNSTVAGIIDPLNGKAWVRRSRCQLALGFAQRECVADLHAVEDGVSVQTGLPAERVQEFERTMASETHLMTRQRAGVEKVSEVPTSVQREERDAGHPDRLSAAERGRVSSEDVPDYITAMFGDQKEEAVDENYIDGAEAFLGLMRFASASYKSSPRSEHKPLPREAEMMVNCPLPPVFAQFPKQRGWPDGINAVAARKVLHRAFVDASTNPWVIALGMRQGWFFDQIDAGVVLKRWHGLGAVEILKAKATLRCGDIVDGRDALRDYLPAYDARIRSNFANNPNRAEVYFLGTTHVAIGFNDFSSLAAATFRDKAPGPLRFVGFEMSEFSVAKSRVVAHMLGSADVAIASVMEVWLSSTWSETTLKDFRKSLNAVLVSLNGRDENPKVLSYLKHWASTEAISAAKARSEFFENLKQYNSVAVMALYSFRREVDRLDLAQYMLTGEVRASQRAARVMDGGGVEATGPTAGRAGASKRSAKGKSKKKKHNRQKPKQEPPSETPRLVGSLTMGNVPEGAPPLEGDIAFNTVNFVALVQDHAKLQQAQPSSADELSVVDLFVVHTLRNLERLRRLMLSGRLTIQVNHGVVKAVRPDTADDAGSHELLARIAMLRPYTISWSNVLDYFLPEDFHDLARRCSVHGSCVHYGYSMNWPTQVYGASILDYDPEQHTALINTVVDAALGFPIGNLGADAVASLPDLMKAVGMDKLLLLPVREHPLNSTGFALAHVFKGSWVEHFMAKGELTVEAARRLGAWCSLANRGLQEGAMELGVPSPLYRSAPTLYMSWCYDLNLRLHAQHPPEGGAGVDTVDSTEMSWTTWC